MLEHTFSRQLSLWWFASEWKVHKPDIAFVYQNDFITKLYNNIVEKDTCNAGLFILDTYMMYFSYNNL